MKRFETGSHSLRTFIAFELPEPVKDHLRAIQAELHLIGRGIRWVQPGNIHLTLKFLGDIRPEDLKVVITALDTAVQGQEPIRLAVKGIGVFPGVRKPRVIWAGLSDQVPELLAFQSRLEDILNDCGFAREDRPFKAHLTFGRVKGALDGQELDQVMRRVGQYEALGFQAEQAILFKSDLMPSGALYTRLHSAPLGLRG
jgi:RNA 2',3'-cyclic 3'-phosphodiesterase